MDGPVVHFQRYTAAVELEKFREQEMSEVQFEEALEAAGWLKAMLVPCRSITSEGSKLFYGSLDAYKATLEEQKAQQWAVIPCWAMHTCLRLQSSGPSHSYRCTTWTKSCTRIRILNQGQKLFEDSGGAVLALDVRMCELRPERRVPCPLRVTLVQPVRNMIRRLEF